MRDRRGFVAGFDYVAVWVSISGMGEGGKYTYSVTISSSTFTVSGRGASSSPKAMRKASTSRVGKSGPFCGTRG